MEWGGEGERRRSDARLHSVGVEHDSLVSVSCTHRVVSPVSATLGGEGDNSEHGRNTQPNIRRSWTGTGRVASTHIEEALEKRLLRERSVNHSLSCNAVLSAGRRMHHKHTHIDLQTYIYIYLEGEGR